MFVATPVLPAPLFLSFAEEIVPKKKKRKGGRKNLHVVPPEHRNVPSDGKFERVALPPLFFFFDRITPPMFHEALYRDGGADWRRSDEVSGSVITFCHRDERGREKKRR